MKNLIAASALLLFFGCQESNQSRRANLEDLKNQVEIIKRQHAEDLSQYAELREELEQLDLDNIKIEEDYAREQKIIDQQNARYNALLDRWEAQAVRMDGILDAQEKQFNVNQ